MVDQCTTCVCSLQSTSSRRYTLTCTKLSCEPCPIVSASGLDVLVKNVSDEKVMFFIVYTSLCSVQLWGLLHFFNFF